MTNIQRLKLAANGYIETLILPSDPLCPMWNRENFIFKKQAKWNYIDGCMIRAVLMLYEQSGDRRLLDYAVRFTCAYVAEDGSIPTMRREDYNLDNIGGARNLMKLYELTGDMRFRLAFEGLADCLSAQPRLRCGSFWHKAIYPGQLWLDGAYMALPFLAEYGIFSHDDQLLSDVLGQLKNIRDLMRDPVSGLYFHGFDETRTMLWADPKTGLSQEFWLRSMGWLCAGLADLCQLLPEEELPGKMLSGLVKALSEHVTGEGMLMQLPAREDLAGNYTETSGTLLFAYAAMKAARLGAADTALGEIGARALLAVTEKFISFEEGQTPVLRNICLMGGLGGAQGRDGSAGYYLSEKIVENDAKGIAPFLMAACELSRRPDQN
ncbi:MAG: glycoside hydrolase family 88 protein [Ruminococcus sp.]|nr:glycoside hydrolase family 88 protein [Ruminococcus sp.]